MRSKDYKSLMNSSTFGQSTSNEYILIIIYHFEVILFAQRFWICELYLHIRFEDWKCLEVTWKDQKIIGHFMIFSSTSQGHNLLNFWSFWLLIFAKCSLRDLLYFIFENQEQNLNGRSCLDWKHYRSFFAKFINFSKYKKSDVFLVISSDHNFQLKLPNATFPSAL